MSPENFKLAFNRIINSRPKEYAAFYPSVLGSYNLALDDNVNDLTGAIRRKTYSPAAGTQVFFPKANGILRPITLLSLDDLIVYQAIANIIAVKFGREQTRLASLEKTFGHIFAGPTSAYFFQNWKNNYERFQHSIADEFFRGRRYLAEFDLAAFYELVDHERLIRCLRSKIDNLEFLELLRDCLRVWTTRADKKLLGHGIPQGPQASALIAECLLFAFDKLNFQNTSYFRYVDDIRLLANNEVTLRRGLLKLDLTAKQLGLVPQADKIRIGEITDVSELFSTIPSALEDATPDEESGAQTQVALLKMFRKSLSGRGARTIIRDVTTFKFALYRLRPLVSVLKKLSTLAVTRPDCSWVIAAYLGRFQRSRQNKAAVTLLTSILRRGPIYDAAAFDFVMALDRCNHSSSYKSVRATLNAISKDSQEKSDLLRVAFGTYIGRRAGLSSASNHVLSPRFKSGLATCALADLLFGDHVNAPYKSAPKVALLHDMVLRPDPDVARFGASLAVSGGAWPALQLRLGKQHPNRSVRLLLKGLGLARRAPGKVRFLTTFFNQRNIIVPFTWRKALGPGVNDAEQRCVQLQKELAYGDPTDIIMFLDVFNEALIQAFSSRHPKLLSAYQKAAGKKLSPDFGNWLNNATLKSVLPCHWWFLDVHKTRSASFKAHVIVRQSGKYSRPVSFSKKNGILRFSTTAWKALVGEWSTYL